MMILRSAFSFLVVCLVLCPLCLAGCQTGGAAGAAGQFARHNLPSLYARTLDNGIPLVVKKNDNNRVFSLVIGLRGHVMFTPSSQAGIEAVALQMLAKGTQSRSYDELQQLLFAKSSTIAAAPNSFDYSSFNLVTLDKYFDELFPVFIDCFLNPRWERQEFEKTVRDMKVKRQQDLTDPLGLAADKLHEQFFKGHPYLANFSGTEESLSRMSLEDVKKYYADTFAPERMCVVAVGNFNPDDLFRRLNAILGKLPRGGLSVPPVPPFAALADSTLILQPLASSVGVAYLRADTPVPSVDHTDYPALLIACAMLDDLLFQTVRIENGAAYGVWANPFSFKQNYMSLVVFKSAVPDKVKQYVDNAIAVLLHGKCLGARVSSSAADVEKKENAAGSSGGSAAVYQPIGEALGFYKAQYINQYFQKQETNTSIALQILSALVYKNDYRDYLYFIDRINSVTAAEVERVSKKYFYDQPKTWIMVSSQDILDKIDRAMFTRFLGEAK
jgi:zinc protease